MVQRVRNILNDERGQGMAEYGLIIALIAVVCIVAITFLGGQLKDKFEFVGKEIESKGVPGGSGGGGLQ